MGNVEKRQVCKCENCGNEAEMVITCSLPEEMKQQETKTEPVSEKSKDSKKVKGTATCSHCGNEADMWIDI
jgi:hypothetical protein